MCEIEISKANMGSVCVCVWFFGWIEWINIIISSDIGSFILCGKTQLVIDKSDVYI